MRRGRAPGAPERILAFTYAQMGEIAAELASNLAEREPSVVGVLLFGSMARGDPNQWSDIDLLVVTAGKHIPPSQLISNLGPRASQLRLSVLSYTVPELERLLETGNSFVEHLGREARIVFDRDGTLSRLMSRPRKANRQDSEELQRELDRLRWFEDPTPFNGELLFCFAQLYAIGKSVVILRLAKEGAPEFNRDRAFQALQRRHPDLSHALSLIEQLKPFYEVVNKQRPSHLPFPSQGTGARVRPIADAIRAVAA